MKPFFAILLAIITLLISFSPMMVDGGPLKVLAGMISVGQWAKILVVSYDLDGTPFSNEPYAAHVLSSDPYFKYIQICFEKGIFNARAEMNLKSSDKLNVSFMIATLDRAKGLRNAPAFA